MTEHQTADRVLSRIRALGLPEPQGKHLHAGEKTFDLMWWDKKVAVEVVQGKRLPDGEGWTVVQIFPTMADAEIDAILTALLV